MYTITNTYDLRKACIDNDWFNSGTNSQYMKMFQMNENGATLDEIAAVIWVCTDTEESNVTLDDIKAQLNIINNEYIRSCDCSHCDKQCIHKDAFRRLPTDIGGLGLCEKLK